MYLMRLGNAILSNEVFRFIQQTLYREWSSPCLFAVYCLLFTFFFSLGIRL
ncbi:unknown protein [Microcystis aeruginosa NIES-843]|uniref:Uncharacterized protein n=1 Tax=Microcystis aeruginosa (strain NIES-843 / IAM M-2473) TaxID=449447 RepID=B0JR72_MICAN|nr:unknown protein [Microcystis aeruginosa NIES-843]